MTSQKTEVEKRQNKETKSPEPQKKHGYGVLIPISHLTVRP